MENLDLGTLQHHGDNILPLLRRLVEVDLRSIDGEYSYTTMREWVTEGRIEDLHRLYDKPYGNPGPTKINMPISSTLKTGFEIQALPH